MTTDLLAAVGLIWGAVTLGHILCEAYTIVVHGIDRNVDPDALRPCLYWWCPHGIVNQLRIRRGELPRV